MNQLSGKNKKDDNAIYLNGLKSIQGRDSGR